MRKYQRIVAIAFVFAIEVSLPLASMADTSVGDPVGFVDPRIGVLGAGSTVIGPALPFGSIHPSPDTPGGGHDGYAPDQPIRGFSQTHVSGTGWGQYGNVLVSPQIGLATAEADHDSPKTDEKAEAYQYQVRLSRYDILARFAPTHRAAMYQFTFPASDQAHLVLDATQHIPGDIATAMFPYCRKPIPSEVTIGEDGRSVGGKASFPGGFGGPYRIYFHAEFDHAPVSFGTWRDATQQSGERSIKSSGAMEHLGAYFRYETKADEAVMMKIAVSFLSVEKAKASLHAEIPGWDYATVRDAAAKTWNDALSSIRIDGGDKEERTIFYTALYHAMIMPRNRAGEFARFAPDAPMFDDHYAVWDTWRTLYPLLSLIRPDVVRDTVNSFIERQRVDGTVPDTFIAGVNKLREQGGNNVDMIIADAFANGIPGVEWEKAYTVLKHNADKRRSGPNFDDPKKGPGPYLAIGWIPADIMSCSMTLEYAYNDYAVSMVAAGLGKEEDASTYLARSGKWENLWNPQVESDGFKGFIMPRKANGEWVDFDPKTYPGSWKNFFYESNSWTYSYFAPHQPGRLVELMGGPEEFTKRLQHALDADLINLHNEPAFLVPQMFHHAGRPDLAKRSLEKFIGEKFTLRGYPGDDDSGAMSSYYIWAKLGLFPNAGQDLYYLNGPAFERAVVRRPGNQPLVITRTGKGDFVASVTLNGKILKRSWLRHADLNGKAVLAFTMSEMPTHWGENQVPPADAASF